MKSSNIFAKDIQSISMQIHSGSEAEKEVNEIAQIFDGVPLLKKVTLSPDIISTLGSDYTTLIDSPGENSAITVNKVVIYSTFNTVSYNSANFRFKIGSGSVSNFGGFDTDFSANQANIVSSLSLSGLNAPFEVQCTADPGTDGNSDISFDIYYNITTI